MNKTQNLWLGALSLLALSPAMAQAEHKHEQQGFQRDGARTGKAVQYDVARPGKAL